VISTALHSTILASRQHIRLARSLIGNVKRMRLASACRWLCGVLAVLAVSGQANAIAEDAIQFGRDILPILSDNCFHCHGPDSKNRAADLRLDTREGATRADSPALVPGKSLESELVRRIESTDHEAVMPPPKSNRKLTKQQIDLLKRWIDAGAPWGKHWAFEAPRRPPLPSTRQEKWIRNPIDAFVLARLEQESLAPSPEASRETLLRRVSLDLTGLPPSLAELDEFLADQSPDAYEKAVDRLLRSPRYGERMVWDWLDAARYADTNGYQGDPTRTMWFWRDWVVRALNDNMPFDRFTIEQLAGDLLPDPTQDQWIATGFHRNHMINGEGGRIAEESRVDYVQDRVETTGTVWLGLTFNCCRCHDHKYDPFTQRDYYRLSAYFNSIDENGGADASPHGRPVFKVVTPELAARMASLKKQEADCVKTLQDAQVVALQGQADWETSLMAQSSTTPLWTPLKATRVTTTGQATVGRPADFDVLLSGANPAQDDVICEFDLETPGVTGIRLDAIPDESLVNQGPGRADNGNFVLTEFKATLDGLPIALKNGKADFEQQGWSAAQVIDGKSETGWAIMPEFGKPHWLELETMEPQGDGKGRKLVVTLEHRSPHLAHVLGRFRISVTNRPVAEWKGVPDLVRKALAIAPAMRSDAQRDAVREFYLATRPEWVAAKRSLDEARKAYEQAEKGLPTTMVMRERAQPRETHVLVRGAWDKPGEKVTHGVPEGLAPLPMNAAPNRLSLARWLVAPENPLTARVTVNRYWQLFFGLGLVRTTEDFGVQSEKPSHPDLLDWLACEFREPTVAQPSVARQEGGNAWNVKHLHRLIVTSATYRQSSRVSPALLERDPENRLLGRGPRYRLPSWMIRDQALAASGLLVEKLGGPPVKGYQPPGIWEEATFGKIRYEQDHGEALYRRSVYQFWRRIVGPAVFFDVANRQTCTVKMSRTNTPLHALVTLNDTTYVEAARALAQRVLLGAAKDDEERIVEAYRRCVGRRPTDAEKAILVERLQKLRIVYRDDAESARRWISAGESRVDDRVDVTELAALSSVSLVLLNLDETLSKE
jgi:mono/diheme cytochrome c family protein